MLAVNRRASMREKRPWNWLRRFSSSWSEPSKKRAMNSNASETNVSLSRSENSCLTRRLLDRSHATPSGRLHCASASRRPAPPRLNATLPAGRRQVLPSRWPAPMQISSTASFRIRSASVAVSRISTKRESDSLSASEAARRFSRVKMSRALSLSFSSFAARNASNRDRRSSDSARIMRSALKTTPNAKAAIQPR